MQKVLFFLREGKNSVWQMLIFTIKVLAPLRKRLEITLFRSERSHWSIAREIHLRKYFPPTDESFNWCVIRTKAKSDFLIAPFSGIILDIAHNHPELFSFSPELVVAWSVLLFMVVTGLKPNYATSQQVNESITGRLSLPYRPSQDSVEFWRQSSIGVNFENSKFLW